MLVPKVGAEAYKALNTDNKNIFTGTESEKTKLINPTLSTDVTEFNIKKKTIPFSEKSKPLPLTNTNPVKGVQLIRSETEILEPLRNNENNKDHLKGKPMKFSISTKVDRDYEQVYSAFSQKELFLKVSPPYIKLNLLRFDGAKENDQIHMELLLPGSKQLWISQVTKVGKTPDEMYFIDEGIKLPFFLKSWQHKHRVIKNKDGAEIIDEISFKTPSKLLDYLLYPVLYKQFNYRKAVYRDYFNSHKL